MTAMAVVMGQVIQFHDNWKKTVVRIASTGRVVEHWEMIEGERRASITRCENGRFRWRAYVAVKHRPPRRYNQEFRTICDVQEAPKLTEAKRDAESYIAKVSYRRN
jgi:hypothetical protein